MASENAKIGNFEDSISLRELMSKAKRVQTRPQIAFEFRSRRDPPVNLWQQYLSKNGDSDDFKLMNF